MKIRKFGKNASKSLLFISVSIKTCSSTSIFFLLNVCVSEFLVIGNLDILLVDTPALL